uniref:Tudor domain-containing protein n=1 Tax=Trichuris muris TaxID=70415 RepID=A0A5S6Q9V7_TRIMR
MNERRIVIGAPAAAVRCPCGKVSVRRDAVSPESYGWEMSCTTVANGEPGDLISFDDEPVLPSNEAAVSNAEPADQTADSLTPIFGAPEQTIDVAREQECTESLSRSEVANLLRLMGKFTKYVPVDKIIGTIRVLTGKQCTKELLIGTLQESGIWQYIKDGSTVPLAGMRSDKYVDGDYLVTSPMVFQRYPVMAFNYLSKTEGENTVLAYDMELIEFAEPNYFVLRLCDVPTTEQREMDYLEQFDSVFWFPARSFLEASLPCLVRVKPGDNLQRAMFHSSTNGQGLFYLVDREKFAVVNLDQAFLIPSRIFRCHVLVYRVRLAFLRPIFDGLWSKAVVEKVTNYLAGRAVKVCFVTLEEDVKPVLLLGPGSTLFEELLALPSAVFNLTEMITFCYMEAFELLFNESTVPLRKLHQTYWENPAKAVRRAWPVATTFRDTSSKLTKNWYTECVLSERRVVATSSFFKNEHLAMDTVPALCFLGEIGQLTKDESLCTRFASLSLNLR